MTRSDIAPDFGFVGCFAYRRAGMPDGADTSGRKYQFLLE